MPETLNQFTAQHKGSSPLPRLASLPFSLYLSTIYDCMESIRLLRISLTMRLGCALRSLKMLSITEISVDVVSRPQKAALQSSKQMSDNQSINQAALLCSKQMSGVIECTRRRRDKAYNERVVPLPHKTHATLALW